MHGPSLSFVLKSGFVYKFSRTHFLCKAGYLVGFLVMLSCSDHFPSLPDRFLPLESMNLQYLCSIFCCRYNILQPPDNQYGSEGADGEWNGMVRQVEDGVRSTTILLRSVNIIHTHNRARKTTILSNAYILYRMVVNKQHSDD